MLSYIFDGYIRIPPLFRGKKHSNITRFLLFLLLLTCLKPQIKLVASGFVATALLLLLVVVVCTKLLLLFFDTLLSKKESKETDSLACKARCITRQQLMTSWANDPKYSKNLSTYLLLLLSFSLYLSLSLSISFLFGRSQSYCFPSG